MRKTQEVELIHIPAELTGVLGLADRRVRAMVRMWAARDDLDLGSLLRSAYLQGVRDGAEALERKQASNGN